MIGATTGAAVAALLAAGTEAGAVATRAKARAGGGGRGEKEELGSSD